MRHISHWAKLAVLLCSLVTGKLYFTVALDNHEFHIQAIDQFDTALVTGVLANEDIVMRLRRSDGEEASGDSVAAEVVEIATEFTIELNNFATMDDIAKDAFVESLKSTLATDLAAANPFEGGRTIVSVELVPKPNSGRRQATEAIVAKLRVRYVAPEGTTRASVADKISPNALKDVAVKTSAAAITTLKTDTFNEQINQASVDNIATEIQETIKPSEVETSTPIEVPTTTPMTTITQVTPTSSFARASISLLLLYLQLS